MIIQSFNNQWDLLELCHKPMHIHINQIMLEYIQRSCMFYNSLCTCRLIVLLCEDGGTGPNRNDARAVDMFGPGSGMLREYNIDGLVQERRNSSALAMDLCLSCTDPSIWSYVFFALTHRYDAGMYMPDAYFMLTGQKHIFFNSSMKYVIIRTWQTRIWNMISSPATPTVCLEQKSDNFHSRNVTLSTPSQSQK